MTDYGIIILDLGGRIINEKMDRENPILYRKNQKSGNLLNGRKDCEFLLVLFGTYAYYSS